MAPEAALSAPNHNQALISSLSDNLEKSYLSEELFWRQQSRLLWLHSGNRNSSYFHAITRGRRVVNSLSGLENELGQEVVEDDQITATVSNYFQKIFTTCSSDDYLLVEEDIQPQITTEINDTLTLVPKTTEIKEAMLYIHPDKALEPGGFLASFYHSYWDSIGVMSPGKFKNTLRAILSILSSIKCIFVSFRMELPLKELRTIGRLHFVMSTTKSRQNSHRKTSTSSP